MKFVITLLTVSLLGLISILHVYWAYGGRWGSVAAIPSRVGEYKPTFTPSKTGTLIIAILLLFACFILLVQGGYIHYYFIPNTIIRVGCIVCAFVFIIRAIGDFKHVGFFKKVNHTVFARNDTWFYSPLCLLFGLTYTILLF